MIQGHLDRFILKVLVVYLLLFSGCGYKNAPIPPENVVPEPIGDVLHTTDETGVQLSWSYPVQTISGKKLDDISSFELYRAEIALDDYCSTCPIPFGQPIKVAGGVPFDGTVRRKANYEDSLLRPGYKYFFKVRSRTSWWAESEDSNIVSLVWFQPAVAPKGLRAIPGDKQVRLSWQPVTSLSDGSSVIEIMKYQILRSIDGNDFKVLGQTMTATGYVDRQVENGVRYYYRIQSMMPLKDELVSGGMSEMILATPVDLTPPASPKGITVVRTGVGIKIFWDRNDDIDLGGYNIYRRLANQKEKGVSLLATVDSANTLFVDSTAGENDRYYYTITAFDRATPPNESKKSKEATVRY